MTLLDQAIATGTAAETALQAAQTNLKNVEAAIFSGKEPMSALMPALAAQLTAITMFNNAMDALAAAATAAKIFMG